MATSKAGALEWRRHARRPPLPHPRRRHLGRRHVLRPSDAAPGHRAARRGAALGAVAPRLRPLLPSRLGLRRRSFGHRLRHDRLGLRRLRLYRSAHQRHDGPRHHHDAGLRSSLFRAVAALPRCRRQRRPRRGGEAADADPPYRRLEPRARADRRRGRRDRALLGSLKSMLELYELAGAEDDRRFSPFCWRARLALAHKGLQAKTVPWRFTEKDRIAPSGQGRVPVLVDDGRWIADSWAIANHLEDAYPDRPSLFGGGASRALSRFYNNWTDAVLHPALNRLTVLDIWRHVHDKDKDYFRRSREERYG